MAFDDIILAAVGLGCAVYLARRVLRAAKGEPGCSGCSGCPSARNGGCGIQPHKDEKENH